MYQGIDSIPLAYTSHYVMQDEYTNTTATTRPR